MGREKPGTVVPFPHTSGTPDVRQQRCLDILELVYDPATSLTTLELMLAVARIEESKAVVG